MTKSRNIADLGSNDVLETTSTGIDVTGTATMDGLTVGSHQIGDDQYGNFSIYAEASPATEGISLKTNSYVDFRSGDSGLLTNDGVRRALIDHATGDISFYEDTGTTAKFFWDASAEKLEIGTSTDKLSLADGSLRIKKDNANKVFIGNTADALGSGTGLINYLYNADPFIWWQGTERMRIDSSGNLLVGKTTTSATEGGLVVYKYGGGTGRINSHTDDNASTYRMRFYNAAGGVAGTVATSSDGSSTSYSTSSDYRLKEDWQPMANASDRVKALNPVNFAWKSSGERVDGFLAHEAQEVVPEAVHGTKDAVDDEGNPDYQGIDQSKLVPLLTAALQEAIAKIETLEQRLTDAGL
jgi:hypothetical protein